ncbi:MAG: GNAT family N-acetyltransferase [bacterium]|nr:GNAT family N-acetyltransferase [bacterium]
MTATIQVRRAKLDDTQAISALFRARVSVWQRMRTDGRAEDVDYERLTLYERWLHGTDSSSAWMSVETGALLLSHLLRGFGLPLVAVVDGVVRAYAEAYPGSEPAPFGSHLHLAHLAVAPDGTRTLINALMDALRQEAEALGCERLTVSVSGYDQDAVKFYSRYGMQPLKRVRRYTLPAATGQSFYKVTDHRNPDPTQIDGWFMSLGRLESARQHWSTFWPTTLDAVDEIAARRTYRLRFNAAGQDSFLYAESQLYDPRSADLYCWSPKPLTPQFLTALRDWAHREKYRTLVLVVPEELITLLGAEAESTPYQQEILALEL